MVSLLVQVDDDFLLFESEREGPLNNRRLEESRMIQDRKLPYDRLVTAGHIICALGNLDNETADLIRYAEQLVGETSFVGVCSTDNMAAVCRLFYLELHSKHPLMHVFKEGIDSLDCVRIKVQDIKSALLQRWLSGKDLGRLLRVEARNGEDDFVLQDSAALIAGHILFAQSIYAPHWREVVNRVFPHYSTPFSCR